MKKISSKRTRVLDLAGDDVDVVVFPLVDILRCTDFDLALSFRCKIKHLCQYIYIA